MEKSLLEFSLENIKSTDWDHFEKFASQFLQDDYKNINTVASPSGDGGRDAELKSIDGKVLILLQYSVADDWKKKVTDTITKVSNNFPDARQLQYITNKRIGAKSDELIKYCLEEKNINLTIKDMNWFLDRAESTTNKKDAASYLIQAIALPLVKSLDEKRDNVFSRNELEIANLALSLKTIDSIGDENLTKLLYDNIVIACLNDTNATNRLTRNELLSKAISLLTNVPQNTVKDRINSSLGRLKKHKIKHWTKDDSFHIAYDQQLLLAQNLLVINELKKHFYESIKTFLKDDDIIVNSKLEDISKLVEKIFVELFRTEGERLSKILRDDYAFSTDYYSDILINIVSNIGTSHSKDKLIEACKYVLRNVFKVDDPKIKKYLRFLSRNYTYQSFLQLADDVNSVIKKINTNLILWVDTNVILPLLSEELVPDEKFLANLFKNLRANNIKIYMTDGVVEELLSHFNRCMTYRRYQQAGTPWEGRTPYFYTKFLESGKVEGSFSNVLDRYYGTENPLQDIIDYLKKYYQIEIKNHNIDNKCIAQELLDNAKYKWQEENEKRRKNNIYFDPSLTIKLTQHDFENYFGVLCARLKNSHGVTGYSEWFFTFDHLTWSLMKDYFTKNSWKELKSPLISINYLVHVMSFVKNNASNDNASIMFFDLINDEYEDDLLKAAEKIRHDNSGIEDHILERKVRDGLNKSRRDKFIDLFR